MKSTIKINGFRCLHCLHEWVPRGPKPKVCPRCKSDAWWKPTPNVAVK